MSAPTLRERKQQRTRESILRTALQLFRRRGIEAVSLGEIAEAAEFGRRTLYRYFSDKEDLVRAVYLEAHREQGESNRAAFERAGLTGGAQADDLFASWEKWISERISEDFFRDELIFDLEFNVYAMKRGQDPTTFDGHVFHQTWFHDFVERTGRSDASILVEMFGGILSYAQRQIMMELQKSTHDWNGVSGRVVTFIRVVRDGYLASKA